MRRKVHLTSLLFDFCEGNATTNLATEWALALRELGLEPELHSHGDFKGSSGYEGHYRGLPCHQLSGRSSLSERIEMRFRSLASACRYAKHLWRHHRNVAFVFAFSTHSWELLAQVLVARLRGIPVVYYLVEEPVSLHRPPVGSSFGSRLRWWRQLVCDYVFGYVVVFRLLNGIACITDELAGYVRSWGYDRSRVLVLPNVKHSSTTQPRGTPANVAPRKADGDFTLFYGGTIDERKEALFPLLEAITVLLPRHPRLALVLTGAGSSAHKLTQRIQENSLAGSVRFLGIVSRERFEQCIAGADLCVVLKQDETPNRYNFANKLTDYMALCKPMLVSDLPLHRRLFKDKATAIFANPNDRGSICDAIRWALQNEDQLPEIGARAGALLRNQLDAYYHAKRLIEWLGLSGGGNQPQGIA